MAGEQATAILKRLGTDGRRRTTSRARVIAAALRREQPFSAQELVRELARHGVGRASVFRTLDLLVSLDVLARIHGLEQGAPCVLSPACGPSHHHHLVCRGCGRVEEIRASGLEERVREIAREHGYEPLGHAIEVQGMCAECRA